MSVCFFDGERKGNSVVYASKFEGKGFGFESGILGQPISATLYPLLEKRLGQSNRKGLRFNGWVGKPFDPKATAPEGRKAHLTLNDRATLPITAHQPQPAKTPRIVFNLGFAQGSTEGHSAGRGQCADRQLQVPINKIEN